MRQSDHEIIALNHTQIPVNGLGWMKKKCWGAGAGQRRGNLPADDAGFAHAGNDHSSGARVEMLDSCDELTVNAFEQGLDRGSFDPQYLSCEIQV